MWLCLGARVPLGSYVGTRSASFKTAGKNSGLDDEVGNSVVSFVSSSRRAKALGPAGTHWNSRASSWHPLGFKASSWHPLGFLSRAILLSDCAWILSSKKMVQFMIGGRDLHRVSPCFPFCCYPFYGHLVVDHKHFVPFLCLGSAVR